MAAVSGEFQINDISFDIPPENIRIERQSFVHKWQTLRTPSSIKSKSGFSVIDIYISVAFTDDLSSDNELGSIRNGYDKLTDIVSQLRVTPFCYVENSLLRDTLLSGNSQQNMALAMKQLEITKSNEDTNVLMANFHFCWFNYFPFTRTFSFKRDIFSPIEVKTPSESNAWKLLYKAEQIRHNYVSPKRLRTGLVANFNQYGSITKKKYRDLLKEVEVLRKLNSELSTLSTKREGIVTLERVQDFLQKELKSEKWAKVLSSHVFGNKTSMGTDNNTEEQVREIIKESLSPENSRYEFITDEYDWGAVITQHGEIITLKESPDRHPEPDESDEYEPEDTILMKRKRQLDFNEKGLIIEGISISFENVLATLPLIGHPYPSYQHTGSIDAKVTLSISTDDQEAIRHLSDFYSLIEGQAHKYRNIPAGFRNVSISNDIVNMCGLRDFLTEGFIIENVEGSPGTFRGILVLVDNPINENTVEKLNPGQSFTTSQDLRIMLSEVLERNLKLIPNAFGTGDDFNLRSLKSTVGISVPSVSNTNVGRIVAATVPLLLPILPVTELLSGTLVESGYYIYGGSTRGKERFADLVKQYGQKLGELLKKVIWVMSQADIASDRFGMLLNHFKALLNLTNQDVAGIEKVVNDVLPVFVQRRAKNYITRVASKEKRREKIADIIDSRNKRSEAQALSGSEDPLLEAKIQEINKEALAILPEDVVMPFGNTISSFDWLSSLFLEWSSFSQRFLDEILNNPSILNLPEFKKVREAISSKTFFEGGVAYPDFPLREVVSILERGEIGDIPAYRSGYYRLRELWDNSNLASKNVDISALINPDFYFFNPQNDVIDDIIPSYVIKKAGENIKKSRELMVAAETDWFKEAYEQRILGKDKTGQVAVELQKVWNENKDKVFSESKEGIEYSLKLQRSFNENAVVPNALFGSVAGGIAQSEEIGGDQVIGLKPILPTIGGTDTENPQAQDSQNVYANYRANTKLTSSPNAMLVKHRFDTDNCLSQLPESEYRNAPSFDPNKEPQFQWPTPSYAQRKTSYFGMRRDPLRVQAARTARMSQEDIKKTISKTSFHNGLDLASLGDSTGVPIYAAEAGIITNINKDYNPSMKKAVRITIRHANGYETGYAHLLWDNAYAQTFSFILHNAAELGFSEQSRERLLTVKKGQQIGLMGSTGYSTGAHLHFVIKNPAKSVSKDGSIDPLPILEAGGEGVYTSQGPLIGLDANNESLLTKSTDQFEKELKSGQGYGMIRAYPAFKLYFIESDLGERKKFAFDDFFSYSAVQDIEVIMSRKIAADLCIIRLTNISGVLNNRKFIDATDPSKAFGEDGNPVVEKQKERSTINTIKENPIASLMLQPGIQIQLRLGFSNNPQELEKLFNGVIVDVEFSESTDLVTIVCQSYAIELVQTIQGDVKSFGGWLSNNGKTFHILEELLAFPEVVHFGRWKSGDFGKNSQRGLLTNRWTFNPQPQDDNIFAPQGKDALGIWDRLTSALSGTPGYKMYHTTIWDVFQEMTLRIPSYIARAVPYDGKYGPRMTMFFGLPDQLYFARDADFEEDSVIEELRKISKEGIPYDNLIKTQDKLKDPSSNIPSSDIEDAVNAKDVNTQGQEGWFKRIAKVFARDRGFIKPFRSYHVLTSSLHILHNSIGLSSHNTFNVATVQYSNSAASENEKTGQLEFGSAKTFTLAADAAIPDEEKRELFAQYPNCVGYEMAKFYSLSLLFNSLKEAYGGSLITIGNPRIQPYDICYIFDEYNDMYGPIEVEQVVHKFSQQNGFITEITPDLMVHVNQHATLSTADAMGLIAEHGLRQIGLQSLPGIINSDVGELAQLAINPMIETMNATFSPIGKMFFNRTENALGLESTNSLSGLLGIFIFRKLITRTQLAHPFRFSPLVLGGKPMIGGLPNRHTDGGFIQGIEKWFKETGEKIPLYLSDVYDKLKPNEWFRHTQGSFKEYVLGGKG